MIAKPVKYGAFTIERVYNASPKRVFAAWTDPEIKAAMVFRAGGMVPRRA
jgi:uncharacterized protein YndB with AHSA1/START domain